VTEACLHLVQWSDLALKQRPVLGLVLGLGLGLVQDLTHVGRPCPQAVVPGCGL
jgi:hypothetical protein